MKQLISLFIIISGTEVVFGQQNKFDVGFEGGPGLICLRGNEILEKYHDPTIGFSGGVFFQYNFSKLFSIRTNIAFDRKGSIARGTNTDMNGRNVGNFTTRLNFNYLTAPILIRAGFGKKVKYFINTGPFFGYLMKDTYITQGTDIPKTVSDNTKNDKPLDLGITAGAGVAIPIKEKIYISCEIRNNLGLYNVSKVPIYNNGSIKTNSTNFLVGVAYKLE